MGCCIDVDFRPDQEELFIINEREASTSNRSMSINKSWSPQL